MSAAFFFLDKQLYILFNYINQWIFLDINGYFAINK